MMKQTPNTKTLTVHIWDLPIRIFHWSLVACVVVMFVSAEIGNFDVHIITGQIIAGLLIARLAWGVFGSSNARLSALVFTLRDYVNYLKQLPKRAPSYSTAHSPVGALAVIAILIALIVQVTTGLVASDVDGLIEGPFAYYIDYDLSRWASEIHVEHEEWLLFLIGLHLAANAFYYFYKHDNLIQAMITGNRQLPASLIPNPPNIAATWKAVVLALIIALSLTWIYVQYG